MFMMQQSNISLPWNRSGLSPRLKLVVKVWQTPDYKTWGWHDWKQFVDSCLMNGNINVNWASLHKATRRCEGIVGLVGKVSATQDEMESIILTDHMSSDNDMEAEVLTTEICTKPLPITEWSVCSKYGLLWQYVPVISISYQSVSTRMFTIRLSSFERESSAWWNSTAHPPIIDEPHQVSNVGTVKEILRVRRACEQYRLI